MKRISMLLLLGLLIGACTVSDKPRKPSASGKAGEMIVVIGKTNWEGRAGEIVQDVFKSYVPMLPQAEPHFNIIHIEPSNFTKLFESHRNIFFVEFDQSLDRGRIEVSRDVWAYPQMVIRVKVPNDDVLERLMQSNEQQFIDYYLATERERLVNAYGRMINFHARNVVRNNLGLDLTVPEGYFVAKHDGNFVWLRQTATREDLDLGLLITLLPYTHPDRDFSHKTIWARRDSITRLHIPGTFPNTYMTTYSDIPPVFREINFNGSYAVEARGLWRVEGDFMGGPFVNITFVDENTSRLVILDGFVYAPKYDKRDYMRQVEALMHSVKPWTETDTSEDEPA
jgi:hypothetical protein